MKAARVLAGMDQKALAAASGVSLPTIQRMEASNGTVRGVIESLTRVMAALDAAHDTIGAVEAHRRLDRARAERVAIHVHLRLPEARRRKFLGRRVEQATVVHALDLVGDVPAEIVDVDHRVGVVREEVGETE